MENEIRTESPDILFLQEVDRDSSRSRHIDETAFFQSSLTDYQATFANNYKTTKINEKISKNARKNERNSSKI